jgi:hypothetical protein
MSKTMLGYIPSRVKINQRQLLTLILPIFSTEVPGTMVVAGVVRRFIWNKLSAGERTMNQEYQQINEHMGIALGFSECP